MPYVIIKAPAFGDAQRLLVPGPDPVEVSQALGEVLVGAGSATWYVPQLRDLAPGAFFTLQPDTTFGASGNVDTVLRRLAGGGLHIHNQPGVFYFNESLIGFDNARLLRGPNTIYRQAPNVNKPMIVTENWQSAQVAVSNGVTDYPSGTYVFVVSGVTTAPTLGATYTNNGVTFSAISTSISGGVGTVTCQASGAPTGSGTLTKSGGTGDATLTFSANTVSVPPLPGMRLAVADCGSNAHGMAVGKSLLSKGDTTRRYLGVKTVDRVIDGFKLAWYEYEKIAIGASSGSVTIELATLGFELQGGVLDYNGQYNQANYDYRAHALIFNKAGRCSVRDVAICNAIKYCVYAVNTDGLAAERLQMDNASDGVHLHGFTKNALVRTMRGSSADDFVAYTPTNDGYTQYDIPNGSMPGDLFGARFEDLQPTRCGEDVLAIYAVGSYVVDNVVVDTLGCATGKSNRLFVLSAPSASAAAATAVGHVTLRNFFGLPRAQGLRLGQYGVQTTVETLDISGLDPRATVDLASGYINCTNFSVGKLIIDARSKLVFDINAARYFLQSDDTCSFGDVELRDYEASTTGAGFAHGVLFFGGASLGRIVVDVPKLSGTAHLFSAAAGGNPEILVRGWNTASYSLARINWPCRLRVFGGRAQTPGGTPVVLLYGSGYTFTLSGITTTPRAGATYTNNGQTFTVVATSITAGAGTIFCTGTGAPAASGTLTRASGTGDATAAFSAFVGLTMDWSHGQNDFGTATNATQYGTAAGDNLSVNEWDFGDSSAAASTTASRTWTSTSGTFRLRASTPWCQHDASKWTSINNGCTYYNNNAGYAAGIGVYQQSAAGPVLVAPNAKTALNVAAVDAATTQALVNQLRALVIANGIAV